MGLNWAGCILRLRRLAMHPCPAGCLPPGCGATADAYMLCGCQTMCLKIGQTPDLFFQGKPQAVTVYLVDSTDRPVCT